MIFSIAIGYGQKKNLKVKRKIVFKKSAQKCRIRAFNTFQLAFINTSVCNTLIVVISTSIKNALIVVINTSVWNTLNVIINTSVRNRLNVDIQF